MAYPHSGLLRCPHGKKKKKNPVSLSKRSPVFLSFSVPKQKTCHWLSTSHKVLITTTRLHPRSRTEAGVELSICVSQCECLSSGSVSCPPQLLFLLLTESPSIYFSLSFLSLSLRLTASRAWTQHTSLSDSSTSLCRYHSQFLYFEQL